MNFKNTALAIAAAGMLAAGVAHAQPEHGGWHHSDMEFLHGVTLTDAQKTQLHTIMQTTWSQTKPIMQQMHKIHDQIITDLLGANAVTQDQLTPLVQQEEQLRAQIDAAKLSTALQVRGLLTQEQLAKASTVHQQLEALHAQEHEVMSSGESPE
jgi:Spy/CpxP family protein refolding chaperone